MSHSRLRTLPIIAAMSACFCLFQNFSLDNDYKDIRSMAPEGVPSEPASPYFPERTRATSMTALGNEILKHNFSDEMKHLENQFEDLTGIEMHRGPASAGPATTAAQDTSGYRLRTGHLGQDKIGFRLQSEVNVKCEYSALKNELQIVVDKSLGLHSSLSFRHNTDDHKSSVNFSYAW